MRGRRVTRRARKEIDIVLIAAKHEPEGGRISIFQGCERRGAVWGDVKLLRRDSIISEINDGKRVVTGRQGDLEGDFEVFAPDQVSQHDGEDTLFTGSVSPTGDYLGIPLF